MGTCGLATGAGEVKDRRREVGCGPFGDDRRSSRPGCIGYCKAEPIMDVVSDYRSPRFLRQRDTRGRRVHPRRGPGSEELQAGRAAGSVQERHGAAPGHPDDRRPSLFPQAGEVRPSQLRRHRPGIHRRLPRTRRIQGSGAGAGNELHGMSSRRSRAPACAGRGGSGFPAGKKWELALASQGEKKYVICNADEGDPGAFMDRSILEGDTYAVLEGMIIAGYAIGADEGIIYCRAEYPAGHRAHQQGHRGHEGGGHPRDTHGRRVHIRAAREKGRRRIRLRRGNGAHGLRRGPPGNAPAAAAVPRGVRASSRSPPS